MLHDAHIWVLHVNWNFGDYVILRSSKSLRYRRSPEWIAPMRIIVSKSDVVFIVENLFRSEEKPVHVQ